jgi:hypothetical protein
VASWGTHVMFEDLDVDKKYTNDSHTNVLPDLVLLNERRTKKHCCISLFHVGQTHNTLLS